MRSIRRQFLSASFTILAIFISLCPLATAQNGWRMDGYNPSRTNASVVAGPNTAPSFSPIATAVNGALLRMTPDGTLLTLSAPNGTFTTVSAYSSSGTFKWSQSLQAEDGFGVRDLAADKSGEIYAATNTAVFSLSPVDGHVVWTHFESANDRSSKLAVGQDGTIYYSNSSGVVGSTPNIVALNADGSVKWHLQNSVAGRLVLSSDESKLYLLGSRPTFGYTYGAIDPVSAIDGSPLPQSPSCDPAGDVYAFAPSNVLYTGDKSGGMTAFSPDVQTCGSLDSLQSIGGIVAIAPDGTLVLAQYSSGALVGMDPSGKLLWSLAEPTLFAFADAGGMVFSLPGSAAITPGQPFPIAATLAKTGQELWRVNFASQVTGALLGDDGCLYLTSGATLYRGCPLGGEISVTTNLAAATFTITGPETYNGSGTTFTQTNAPAGNYTISYAPVAGYLTPAGETQRLNGGASILFSGTYNPTAPPPPPPTIQAVTPAKLNKGETVQLTITGMNLTGGSLSLLPSDGIVLGTPSLSAQNISVSVTVEHDAALGAHTLFLSNANGMATAVVNVVGVPVIFIPGIEGSELGFDDAFGDFVELWPNPLKDGTSIGDLRKDPDGSDVTPGIWANDLITGVFFGLKEVYQPFLNYMDKAGLTIEQVRTGANSDGLFLFPYDWRDSSTETAWSKTVAGQKDQNLREIISDIIATTGAEKVDLIAHSMGGIVAMEYLRRAREENLASYVRHVVTVGTPFYGSPDAFEALRYGDEVSGWARIVADATTMKRVAHNAPAVYQLLPSNSYFGSVGKYGSPQYIADPDNLSLQNHPAPTSFVDSELYLRNAPEAINQLASEDYVLGKPYLNPSILDDTNLFHGALDESYGSLPATISLTNIVGWHQFTSRMFTEDIEYKICNFGLAICAERVAYARKTLAGDGRVPIWSASLPSAIARYYLQLSDYDHASLMSSPCVDTLVLATLRNVAPDLNKGCSSVAVSDVLPDVNDVTSLQWQVAALSPVHISLEDNAGHYTGIGADGSVVQAVPQSTYDKAERLGAEQLTFIPTVGQTLTVSGIGNGTFDLKIFERVDVKTARTLIFRNIPVTTTTTGTITPTWGGFPILNLDLDGDGKTDAQFVPSESFTGDDPIEEPLDIKPGSADNPINLSSKGVTPLAILSTPSFDATQIDISSVRIGRTGATPTDKQLGIEDVNGDGKLDAVLHFATQSAGIQKSDTVLCLTGKTRAGVSFHGCDAIRIVP